MSPTAQGPRKWYINLTDPEATILGRIGVGKSCAPDRLSNEVRSNFGRKVRVNPSPKHDDLHDGTDNR